MNSAKICWLTCGKAVSNPVINSDINKEISVLSPFGGGRCFVAIKKNSERMREIASNGKITLALEAYYNVVGMLPPVNNIGKHETSKFPDYFGGIQRSHLVYKGLNRPCVKRGMDLELYVYISKQEYKYKYVPDMVCPAKQVAVNDGFLFAVIVSFSDGQNKTGEVLNWEWVESSPDDPSKPIDFESRYEKERLDKMNMLRADLLEKFDIELAESFNPIATYNKSLDFIEYLSVDATCVSRRIDEHLTLLLDMDNELELIGFKLKGFACIYGEIMQNAGIENHQAQFSGIVEILVELISKMGDKMFPAQKAEYARVIKFASKKDVKLDMNSLKVA